MNFRNRIKELCQNNGITQKELAGRLGISDISLNQTLRGDYPQLQTLERISNALGVSVTELFEEKKEISVYIEYRGETKRISEKDLIKLFEK